MVQYCVVPGCKSNALDPGISFHLFPQNPVMKKMWALRIRRDEQSNKNISSTMRICSQHFLKTDYKETPNKKWLKKEAVPSLFSFNSPSTNRPQRRVTPSVNSAQNNKFPVEMETFPKVDHVNSFGDELNKLHFVKKSTDRTYLRKFRKNSVTVVQRPILNNISIPLLFLNKPGNLSSEIQNKEETLHQLSETGNIKEDDSINDDSDISDDLIEEMHFSYVELVKHLEQIRKPNSWWTLSCCEDFVMCAKWDASYFCQRRVVVCKDLTVKVFVKNTKVLLDSKINSCESLSSLLQIVDEL